ncbi:MAG: glycoside hydrolase family 2 protein, partial [Acutalibacteraceae bacterium]|nr:glycoside hydrolase family 2 protein [Acutalibacteraceae bacterium]
NAFPSKTGWIPMQVPGDVTCALVDAGIIEEPFLKTNTKKNLWIRDLSWWLIKEFEVTAETLEEDIVRLNIEMLDFNADILLNGMRVAHHENAFCAFSEDVKRFLQVGKNQLVIRLTSGMELHYPKDSVSYYCASDNAICDQRVYTRKPQFTYGWDWCQPVPTCGIGRSIEIEAFSGAKVSAARVDTLKLDGSDAEIEFNFEIEKSNMVQSAETEIEYALEIDGETVYTGRQTKMLVGGINYVSERVTLQGAKLWWPNGYGAQNLYTFTARCTARGITNEMPAKRIGIRTIELDTSKLEDGSRNFFFKVNGTRIFCKGGNWVPTDSLYLRTPDSSYKTLVSEGAAANFTMFRMWGGGTYEPDCFYEYCSEYGILLMHDFMYACGFYPDHLDSFLFEAEREAEYQTKRLAHYPCMAVWTGNNEISESYSDWFPAPVKPDRFYGEKVFNYIQPRAVHRNSPMVPYMPSSPYFGERANLTEEGDVHAWSYFGRDPKTKFKFVYELEAFDRIPARFSSEYGFFGAQMESTVRRYHDGEEMAFDGEIWKHHGEFDRKRSNIDGAINRHITDFSTLDIPGYLTYSGIMQGLLYAELAEAMRQKPYGAGDLIWMYNDCWPETGWTIIDYYLTRKVSFYFLKRAFQPRKLIIRKAEGGARVTVINETPEPITAEITCGYMTFDGKTDSLCTKTAEAAPHSWQQFDLAVCNDLQNGFYFASAEGFDTADSLRAYYRDYVFPESHAKIEAVEQDGNDLLVTVSADVYTPFAYLMTSDDRVHYSDNYFTLYPNEKKTIRVENCTETPALHIAKTMPSDEAQKANYTDSWF